MQKNLPFPRPMYILDHSAGGNLSGMYLASETSFHTAHSSFNCKSTSHSPTNSEEILVTPDYSYDQIDAELEISLAIVIHKLIVKGRCSWTNGQNQHHLMDNFDSDSLENTHSSRLPPDQHNLTKIKASIKYIRSKDHLEECKLLNDALSNHQSLIHLLSQPPSIFDSKVDSGRCNAVWILQSARFLVHFIKGMAIGAGIFTMNRILSHSNQP